MAGKSDQHASLPRFLKRLWTLGDQYRTREQSAIEKNLWIEAQAHCRRAVKNRERQSYRDAGSVEEG